jgi:hypothetical protein
MGLVTGQFVLFTNSPVHRPMAYGLLEVLSDIPTPLFSPAQGWGTGVFEDVDDAKSVINILNLLLRPFRWKGDGGWQYLSFVNRL